MASRLEPRERLFELGNMCLSGIEAGPSSCPRGVVLALHGSGHSGRYWDCPNAEESSLLRLGSRLGFRVAAIDRPGYGVSRTIGAEAVTLDAQATLLGQLIAELRAESAPAPVFLIGHSLGSLLAVRLAAREAAQLVTAIDVTGLPVEWREEIRTAVKASPDAFGAMLQEPANRLALFFGPSWTYDPKVLEVEHQFSHRIPRTEMTDSLASPDVLRELAPDVRIPVQCTIAEFEKVVASSPAAVTRDRNLFSASRRAVAHWQPGAGHNVSLHRVGRAYHLRALAFFEEAAAMALPVAALEARL